MRCCLPELKLTYRPGNFNRTESSNAASPILDHNCCPEIEQNGKHWRVFRADQVVVKVLLVEVMHCKTHLPCRSPRGQRHR